MMNFVKTLAIIFVFYICAGMCQDLIIVSNLNSNETVNSSSTERSIIPESLLIQMKDVQNVTDLLSRFVVLREQQIFFGSTTRNVSTNSTGRAALAAGAASSPGAISEPANCRTEEHVVELDRPDNAAVMYWPSCVRVRRCGGCCTSTMLACKPVSTSIVNVTVLQMLYSIENPNTFEHQGTRVFSLEQHDRCSCSCKELPEDCDPDVHEYKAGECRCACKNMEPAVSCTGHKKVWDWKNCVCKCRNVRMCSTGRYFNTLTCRCEMMRISLLAQNSTFPQSSLTTTAAP